MSEIFIIYEERESSPLCGVRGIFSTREAAVKKMRQLISNNPLYTEYSETDFEEATSESDPQYEEEEYSNYSILKYSV